MRRVGNFLGGLALAAMTLIPNVSAVAATYPNGPGGADGNLDGTGGFFDSGRQLDFDFWFSVLDVVLPDVLPTWNSGGTPVWDLVTHQTGPLFGGADNDNNTIHDDDHLDLLAAVYDGDATVVQNVPSGTVTAVRNAFDANLATLFGVELTLEDVNLQASVPILGSINETHDVTTGGQLTVSVLDPVDIPSLWSVNEDAAGGDEGVLAAANPMLEAALFNVLPGYMTIAAGVGSSEEVHVQSLIYNFLEQFLQTGLESLLADVGDVSNFNQAPDGTITLTVTVDTGIPFVGEIDANVTVPGTSVTTALNDFSDAFNCTDFTCGTAIRATGNLNGTGNNNVSSWSAASGNRQTFMTNEGITNPPLQFVPMPVDVAGDLGNVTALGSNYVLAGGDGSTKTFDWEDVEPVSYEDPTALGGTTTQQTYTFSNVQFGDAGHFGVATSDNTWERVSRTLELTVSDLPPRVASVTVNSGTTVDIAFTEPMGTGVGNPGNYSLSGTGKGSLFVNPNSVSSLGGNVYRLTWSSGEMFNGGDITIAVATGVQSSSGQLMGSPSSGTCAGCATATVPAVNTFTSSNPGPSKATSLTYSLVFSESVTGVNAGKFSVFTTGSATGSVGVVSGSGAAYSITVTGVGGTGNVRLDLSNIAGITDGAGNGLASVVQGQVSVVDNTPPATPTALDLVPASDSGSLDNDDITNDTTPVIQGQGELNSIIDLVSSIDGAIGTTTVSSGTSWSLTTSALSEGVHTITATARDSLNNTSGSSAPLVITIDTTAPAVPGVPDLAAASDTGAANNDEITNDTTPTLQGTRVSGVTIEVQSSVDGIVGSDSGAGTSYAVTAGALTANTDHSFRARGTDVAGNQSGFSTGLVVTIDTQAPTVDSQDPPAGATVATLPDVDVTFDEAVANVAAGDLTVNGSAATGVSGSGAGPYTFTGYSAPADAPGIPVAIGAGSTTDLAGNAFAGDGWTINKDATTPTISWSSGDVSNGGLTNSAITLTATFSEAVTGFVAGDVTVGNGSLGSFSGSGDTYSFDITPAGDGLVTIDVAAGQAEAVAAPAGRFNAVAPQFSFTSDQTAPLVTQSVPETTGPTNNPTVNFTVTFDSPVTGFNSASDVTVLHLGTAHSGVSIVPVSTTEYTVEVTGLSGNGLTKLQVNAGAAQDAAGNLNPVFVPAPGVQIDTVAPVVTVDTLSTNDNTPSLSGTVDDISASVTVTVGGQNLPAAVSSVGFTGVWTLPDNVLIALADGTYNVTAAATDFVGNVGNDATIDELTIDATAPVITLTGSAVVSVGCGDGYVEEGFTASDAVDGDVSGSVVVSGDASIPVTTPPGTYTIIYTVSDSLGNVSMENRTVIVEDDCPLAVSAVGPTEFERDGGDSVSFSVQATGNIGGLTYQWFQTPANKAGDVAVPGGVNATLTLSDLENDDEGAYYCQVADAVTAVQSTNFTLTVFVFVPAAGFLGLGAAVAALAAAGGVLVRRRKR